MVSLQEFFRSLKTVDTISEAKGTVGRTLIALSKAARLPGAERIQNEIRSRRLALEVYYGTIKDQNPNLPHVLKTDLIRDAYVTIAGIEGSAAVLGNLSIAKELVQAAKEAPALVGKTLGDITGGVGDIAGNLVGSFLAGLGPILIIIIVAALVLKGKLK